MPNQRKKFDELNKQDFHAIGRSLESHMSMVEIMFLPNQLEDVTDERCAEIVGFMKKELLPSDLQQSQHRSLIRLACMNAFGGNGLSGLIGMLG